MKNSEHLGAFTDVDSSNEPQKWQQILEYVSSLPEVILWRKNAIDSLKLKDGMVVLDVGCGLGNTTRMMSELISPAGKITGLDISQVMIDEAKKKSKNTIEDYRVEDVTQLDFADNIFDAIHVERVLHHVKNIEQALRELHRVLKPSGRLCLFEPALSSCSIYPLPSSMLSAFSQTIVKTAQNGDIGLHLLELTKKLNFTELQFRGWSLTFRDLEFVKSFLPIADLLNKITGSLQQTQQYIDAMQQANKDRTFLFSIPSFQLIVKK
jgi:SAM-dependent methyltransferase